MFVVRQLMGLFVAASLLSVPASALAADKRDAIAQNGMVAAADPRAAQVGVDILKKGGNAVDAAVATAFALFAAEPNASGISGGGFAIIYVAKEDKSYIVDYREVAPAKAHEKFYVDLEAKTKVPVKQSKATGYYATGVPGMIAGMEEMANKFGTMKFAELIEPTTDMLEKGVVVNEGLAGHIMDMLDRMAQSPTPDFFMNTYFKDGLPLEAGQAYYNNDLLNTLKVIAAKGSPAFYTGEIADKIADFYAKNADGWITKKDLADFKVIIREPIEGMYRGYKIAAVPPPSSGGLTIIEILGMLEQSDMKKMGHGSADSLHTIIEAQKLAYADRDTYMGDPAFVNVPVKQLSDPKYTAERAKLIDMKKANHKLAPGKVDTSHGTTTSLSVIDKAGNMVTVTHSLNAFFGALVAADGTGMVMNNVMDDFSGELGLANSVAPGRRPLSSISPALVSKDGKPFMTLGSPGGPRIITALSTVMVNVIDYGMNIQDANNALRVHNPNSATTSIEGRVSPAVRTELEARGHKLDVKKDLDLYFGGVHAIMVLPDGSLHGSGDLRRSGLGVGY